jgi:hypothetical protein
VVCVRCSKEKEGVKMEFLFSLNMLFACLQEEGNLWLQMK